MYKTMWNRMKRQSCETETMDIMSGGGGDDEGRELFEAQSHLYKHIFNFINSMALKCAVQLGIPDIIHTNNPPLPLPRLLSALHLPPEKASYLRRLMRLLVHSGFFATEKLPQNQEEEEEEEGYVLTPSSRLLIRTDNNNSLPNLSAFVLGMLDPVLVTPWHFLGGWFKGDDGAGGGLTAGTAFHAAHGKSFWEYGSHDRDFFNLFNEALASDSRMMSLVIKDCRPVFEGLGSLVDLGGGKGLIARIISEAFPELECTVFDFPRVVSDLPDSANLKYVGGDMFHSVPSADAILLKLVLHSMSDEECVKILKKCKEAIPRTGERGKVIIIDIVIDEEKDEHDITEGKLLFDLLMMTVVTGRERKEKEWEKLFLEAGFTHYKITPIFGLRSLIEVFP